MINKESSLEQYTGYQTGRHSPVRLLTEILKSALQELGKVYHKLQEADQHNLVSKDILQAAISELSSPCSYTEPCSRAEPTASQSHRPTCSGPMKNCSTM